jgi:flavodoxin
MRAVVVYESSYGNTHFIAEAIAHGLSTEFETTVVSVAAAEGKLIENTELLVVGGPTHVHGMSRPSTRKAAIEAGTRDHLPLDPDADGLGLREWFATLGNSEMAAAAFDTRLDSAPPLITGRASKKFSRRLRKHGFHEVIEPESFLVNKHNELDDGELERAQRWGERLAELASRSLLSRK